METKSFSNVLSFITKHWYTGFYNSKIEMNICRFPSKNQVILHFVGKTYISTVFYEK